MVTNIDLAEKKFQQLIPFMKEIYPEERKDKTNIIELVKQYEDMMVLDKVIVALGDNRNNKILFLSKNFEQIAHYKIATLLKWGSLHGFKTFHPTHYSFPFATFRIGKKFQENLSLKARKDTSAYAGGLKLVNGKGQIRIAFIKYRALLWTNDGFPDVTIMFCEDVTHLMKSGHYWMRFSNPLMNFVYVNQKGKKEFTDLVSNSELKVLKLIAEKKTNAEIAEELILSRATVETHRKNMIKRVGAVDSTALVHLCSMAGIL